MKKIIIIGAGHGGLIVGYLLAKDGYDVTIYEKKSKKDLGYDFIDTFDINPFLETGIKMPKKILFSKNITFYLDNGLAYKNDNKKSSVRMHRKDIYDWLIDECLKVGVKINYSKEVTDVILKNNKVLGILIKSKKIYGDLIINAAGINYNDKIINRNINKYDIFNVFRYTYNKLNKNECYNVYLKPNGVRGISWFLQDSKTVDLLIGNFGEMANIFNQINYLSVRNNDLKKINVHKKFIYKIPIREPLSLMINNNYALIGDSACMTEPLNGSGLSLCAMASKILYETIIECENYSINELYYYQYKYYKKIGVKLAKLGLYKYYLLKINQKQLINIFKLLKNYNIKYVIKLLFDSQFIKNSIKLGYRYLYLNYLFLIMPKQYDVKWKNKYDKFFEDIKKETFN